MCLSCAGDMDDVASQLVERVLAKVVREERLRAVVERERGGGGEGEKVSHSCKYIVYMIVLLVQIAIFVDVSTALHQSSAVCQK